MADNFLGKSDNQLFDMREQVETIETEKTSTYPIKLKNRMRYRDGINQIYLDSNRHSLVGDNQHFYEKGDAYRYKTVIL